MEEPKKYQHWLKSIMYLSVKEIEECQEYHNQLKKNKYDSPVCKGSWAFGNNCKKCERCIDTKPKPIEN